MLKVMKSSRTPHSSSSKAPTPQLSVIRANNVYADLGLKDAKGMLAKAQLAFKINEFIRSRKVSKAKAARIMEISQLQLADVLKGRFRETSLAQIKRYLKRLEIDEDPLVEDVSGYIGKLKWRKAHFKFAPNDASRKSINELERDKGQSFKSVKAFTKNLNKRVFRLSCG